MSNKQTKTEKAPKQKQNSGRDSRGRFAKGNPGGPGNPFARQLGLLRAVMVETFRPELMARTVVALIEKAVAGDVPAAKLLFTFILGKPAEMVDPDRLAIDEWQKLQEKAVDLRETNVVLEKCPATVACELVTMQWPAELERTLRDGAEEAARVEAEVAEDERYFAELEAAEAEEVRKKTEQWEQKPAVRPEPDHAVKAAPAQSTAPKTAAREKASPSTNGENGSSPGEESAKPAGPGDRLISRLAQRINRRYGDDEAQEFVGSPSPNGELTAAAEDI